MYIRSMVWYQDPRHNKLFRHNQVCCPKVTRFVSFTILFQGCPNDYINISLSFDLTGFLKNGCSIA